MLDDEVNSITGQGIEQQAHVESELLFAYDTFLDLSVLLRTRHAYLPSNNTHFLSCSMLGLAGALSGPLLIRKFKMHRDHSSRYCRTTSTKAFSLSLREVSAG